MFTFFKRWWMLTLFNIVLWLAMITDAPANQFLNNFFTSTVGILIFIFIEYGVFKVLNAFHIIRPKKQVKKRYNDIAPISDALIQHYKEQGLSESEIRLFRQTMKDARDQIMSLESSFNQSKLQQIEQQIPVITICQSIFKELVQEPQKLNIANQFLYQHLPNISTLATKYVEVSRQNQISHDSDLLLETTYHTIFEVAQLIMDDYQQFNQDDREQLNDEIRLAQQQLKQKETTYGTKR